MRSSLPLLSVIVCLFPVSLNAQGGGTERGGGNDECATAIPVVVTTDCAGSLAVYDATTATQSRPAVVCSDLASPQANDLWFSFTAISNGTAVEVEGTSSFDPVIEAFSGTCGALISVGCADATYPMGAPPQNSNEIIYVATDPGTTYYVRIYSYWNPVPVDFGFSLCIHEVNEPPANDLCSSVAPVPVASGTPLVFTGDDSNALDTEGLDAPSVWHAFTIGACANVTVDLCGTVPARVAPFTGLYTDCTLGTLIGRTSVDPDACTDGNTTAHFVNLSAGTYYYPVLQDGPDASGGPYTLTIVSTFPTAYCEANTVECDEYIARVVIGGIDNSTDCTQGGIADHTAISTSIERTQALPIVVYNGPISYGEDSVAVWVDWDQDFGFCGPNEHFTLTSSDDGITYMGNITAPADAVLGNTRMRVRMVYSAPPQACGASEFGEVEDYTLVVSVISGIQEPIGAEWGLFPNPSDGNFSLRTAGIDVKVDIELLDAMGRMIHQEQRTSKSGGSLTVNGAAFLSPGVYVVRVTSPHGVWAQRLIVQ